MQLIDRSVVLIYPFVHDLCDLSHNRRCRSRRLTRLGALWQPWWRRLSDGELAEAIYDCHFFLPFVRELLFPETVFLKGATLEDQA